MIGLPKTTEFNKRIPKQKFYENIDVSPTLKKVFVEQVKTIYWKNKIAAYGNIDTPCQIGLCMYKVSEFQRYNP